MQTALQVDPVILTSNDVRINSNWKLSDNSGTFTLNNGSDRWTLTSTGGSNATSVGVGSLWKLESTGSNNIAFTRNAGGVVRFFLDDDGSTANNGWNPLFGGNTGSFVPPSGTTAQRPSTPYDGSIRWNQTTSALEVYTGAAWQSVVVI